MHMFDNNVCNEAAGITPRREKHSVQNNVYLRLYPFEHSHSRCCRLQTGYGRGRPYWANYHVSRDDADDASEASCQVQVLRLKRWSEIIIARVFPARCMYFLRASVAAGVLTD